MIIHPEVRNYLAEIGRRGGKVKSPRKSAVSRVNGKRGGRPKDDEGTKK